MYEIYPVADSIAEAFEQLGTKRKFWFWNDKNKKILFKEGRPKTGENWAEKIAAELCSILSIPHAEYDLATWRGYDGIISPSFVPEGWRLVLGNELLSHISEEYNKEAKYKQKQYTLKRTLALVGIEDICLPVGFSGGDAIKTASDVFIGYLMLDAWIANQDRHHENWGVIVSTDKKIYLTPTFDHASSLGRNENDRGRIDRLTTKDKRRSMEQYVKRATTPFYSSSTAPKPLSTTDVFFEAAKFKTQAALFWLQKLEAVSQDDTLAFFRKIPPTLISQPAIDFAQRILLLNKERLLSLREELV